MSEIKPVSSIKTCHERLKGVSFRQPEKSEWKCYLFGHPNGITFYPDKGKEPNWFWRKMQYLILGHKWVKE